MNTDIMKPDKVISLIVVLPFFCSGIGYAQKKKCDIDYLCCIIYDKRFGTQLAANYLETKRMIAPPGLIYIPSPPRGIVSLPIDCGKKILFKYSMNSHAEIYGPLILIDKERCQALEFGSYAEIRENAALRECGFSDSELFFIYLTNPFFDGNKIGTRVIYYQLPGPPTTRTLQLDSFINSYFKLNSYSLHSFLKSIDRQSRKRISYYKRKFRNQAYFIVKYHIEEAEEESERSYFTVFYLTADNRMEEITHELFYRELRYEGLKRNRRNK